MEKLKNKIVKYFIQLTIIRLLKSLLRANNHIAKAWGDPNKINLIVLEKTIIELKKVDIPEGQEDIYKAFFDVLDTLFKNIKKVAKQNRANYIPKKLLESRIKLIIDNYKLDKHK